MNTKLVILSELLNASPGDSKLTSTLLYYAGT